MHGKFRLFFSKEKKHDPDRLFRIKELELKSSNIDGRLQEREDDYSRK